MSDTVLTSILSGALIILIAVIVTIAFNDAKFTDACEAAGGHRVKVVGGLVCARLEIIMVK